VAKPPYSPNILNVQHSWLVQYPRFSPTRTTVKSVRIGLLLIMVVTLQIRSGDRQSMHTPVVSHGVLRCKRLAFIGDATLLTRSRAPSRSLTILFTPATTITLLGPKIIAATRFPTPSTLTSWPVYVMALLLVRKTSAVSCCLRIAVLASWDNPCCQCCATSFPRWSRAFKSTSSRTVSDPPTPTNASGGMRFSISSTASVLVEAYFVWNPFS
jgi:hypothetical protein